jgi:hypothetical protein
VIATAGQEIVLEVGPFKERRRFLVVGPLSEDFTRRKEQLDRIHEVKRRRNGMAKKDPIAANREAWSTRDRGRELDESGKQKIPASQLSKTPNRLISHDVASAGEGRED